MFCPHPLLTQRVRTEEHFLVNHRLRHRIENLAGLLAYITVTGKTGKAYNLQYWRYYDVPKPAPPQWESLGTLVLPECELDVDTEYVLGCNGGNDCKFMRRYDIITHAELKLLEKK
ncbi:hypothetical protein ANCDUO_14399 [Ancylostoma duodenale]|uniref:Uncharacterized protein n=1 Tax=Ancylostoma duodenale TaxID=51022 RepID=A0A0C2CGF9_9BILA|nr:hypothetical protein ANCDUO_14399 [Ancylostoma duodenale]